jgi:glutamate-1-semialdehyde 2,1-aminomutase
MGNEELFKRAQEVIPGGVNSPVRAFKSVGGTPYFVARAEGAHVWDVEGKQYIDYVQSYGASILGHAHPKVVEAIRAAALDGSTYGAPTEREVLLAETIAERVTGCDMVRLVSSGTEAAMSAIRVARGVTGRSRAVMFEGNYHGHSDGLLAAGGSGMATLALPASAGVPQSMVAETVVVPYNEVPEIGDDVAAVIVEPVAANHGVIPPTDGFLAGLRAACDRAGALLIFDEVITGFRLRNGAASDLFDVRPDLWCFGKVIGGGLPLAAFAGRRDVMEVLAPVGPVYQAGTLSGNPIATAAGLAVLDLLDDESYGALTATAARLGDGLGSLGIEVRQVSTLLGVTVADYPAFFHHLLDRGIALAPGQYEALFPSLAHTAVDIDATIEAASAFGR